MGALLTLLAFGPLPVLAGVLTLALDGLVRDLRWLK